MAERDIVGGLFGVTPEMYQQNRQQQQLAEAIKMGSLTPEQFIGTQAYRGGQALGNVAGSLLGVEDPQMQLISRTNQLVQEIGIDTPEKLRTLAGELQKIPGGAPLAAQAIGQANLIRPYTAIQISHVQHHLAPLPFIAFCRESASHSWF
jgi:hypothetical protein